MQTISAKRIKRSAKLQPAKMNAMENAVPETVIRHDSQTCKPLINHLIQSIALFNFDLKFDLNNDIECKILFHQRYKHLSV